MMLSEAYAVLVENEASISAGRYSRTTSHDGLYGRAYASAEGPAFKRPKRYKVSVNILFNRSLMHPDAPCAFVEWTRYQMTCAMRGESKMSVSFEKSVILDFWREFDPLDIICEWSCCRMQDQAWHTCWRPMSTQSLLVRDTCAIHMCCSFEKV